MNRGTARPHVARPAWFLDFQSLIDLIWLYATDKTTLAGLDRIFSEHVEPRARLFATSPGLQSLRIAEAQSVSSVEATYLADLEQLAEVVGLHRVAGPGMNPGARFTGGHAILHRSMWLKALSVIEGRDLDTANALRMSIALYGPHREATPDGTPARIEILLDAAWNPRDEELKSVRKRLRDQIDHAIDDQLEEIARYAEGAEYSFRAGRDTKHLYWLFWKLKDRLSYQQIVTHHKNLYPYQQKPGRDAVIKAVTRSAEDLGIDRTGW